LPPANPNIRLTHLLTSSEVPLETDIPSIRDLISQGQSRDHALKAEILRLEDVITQLNRRRIETANYIRQHRAVISSVRRVPPELITKIFALTLKSRGAWDAKDAMNQPLAFEPNLSIVEICSAPISSFVFLHHRPLIFATGYPV
jgi:hypothetical protein